MSTDTEIKTAELDQLYLDPLNYRLGRGHTGADVLQEDILELMRDWTLDELAVSFLDSNFWPQEALLVVKEPLYGKDRLVVVEGNRRLAALKYLDAAVRGKRNLPKWTDVVRTKKPSPKLFKAIPYMEFESRTDIESFLGFRHVTGIKEWRPAEKAQFIAKLIEERSYSYEQVMRKIGSKTATVRQHYISYRVLLQMEDEEDISIERVEDKFSVLYLSLKTAGAQRYLQVDIKADPKAARKPIPSARLKALAYFALWLFGDETHEPLFTDSRSVDSFGTILESPKAVQYLERTEKPHFDVAHQLAGGDEPQLIKLVEQAADNVELALTRAHLHAKSPKLQQAVERCGADVLQLLKIFPDVKERLLRGNK